MVKAILFDLDGTLLDVDMDDFLRRYLTKLAAHFSPFMEPQAFVTHLMASTQAMIENIYSDKTNRDVFYEHFSPKLNHPPEIIQPHIDDFYERVFPELKGFIRSHGNTAHIMEAANSLDVPLVLATNPVFPLAAIRHRMNWAGLSEEMFTLITSYENMHFCKPNPEYYLEIAAKIGVPPSDCLMIGNDTDDDIRAAAQTGMKTYLVKNMVVNKSGCEPQADYCGLVEELPAFLEKLKEDRM